jgi:hypothetical protein
MQPKRLRIRPVDVIEMVVWLPQKQRVLETAKDLRALLTISTLVLSVGLASAPAAFAQDEMGKDGMKKHDVKGQHVERRDEKVTALYCSLPTAGRHHIRAAVGFCQVMGATSPPQIANSREIAADTTVRIADATAIMFEPSGPSPQRQAPKCQAARAKRRIAYAGRWWPSATRQSILHSGPKSALAARAKIDS